MNKDFLYFLQALYEIDRKYFSYSNYNTSEPSFITLIKWGQLNIEWNKDALPKLKELQKELELIGLEVSPIIGISYGYKLVAKLPEHPTRKLLYDQT